MRRNEWGDNDDVDNEDDGDDDDDDDVDDVVAVSVFVLVLVLVLTLVVVQICPEYPDISNHCFIAPNNMQSFKNFTQHCSFLPPLANDVKMFRCGFNPWIVFFFTSSDWALGTKWNLTTKDASNSFSSHSKIAWTWRWDWTVPTAQLWRCAPVFGAHFCYWTKSPRVLGVLVYMYIYNYIII